MRLPPIAVYVKLTWLPCRECVNFGKAASSDSGLGWLYWLDLNPVSCQPPDAISPNDDRWTLIQRIVASHLFSRAPQLRGFLLFVTSRALAGRQSEITECEIACAVLGRKTDFNPHEDNIVRVQARHLRAKLDQYFEAEGKEERVIVTIPRGGYVPVFAPRATPAPVTEIQPTADPQPVHSVPPRAHYGRYVILGGLFAVLVAIGASFMLRVQGAPVFAKVNQAALQRNSLLSKVFLPGDSATIVMSDAGVAVLQAFLRRRISLESYLKGDYPRALIPQSAGSAVERMLELECVRSYTTWEDVGAAHRLLQLGQSYHAKTVIRHPRHLNVRDFETGGFVLLGGPLANPWYTLFEGSLNFAFEFDVDTGKVVIRNKAPQSGEQMTYSPNDGPVSADFALAALLPNLKGSGSVLLLAGTAMQGTEAAGDMIARDELPAELQSIVSRAKGAAQTIEILFQAQVVAGIPRDVKVVASRVHSPTL